MSSKHESLLFCLKTNTNKLHERPETRTFISITAGVVHNKSFNSKASVANMTSAEGDLLTLLPSTDLVHFCVVTTTIIITTSSFS